MQKLYIRNRLTGAKKHLSTLISLVSKPEARPSWKSNEYIATEIILVSNCNVWQSQAINTGGDTPNNLDGTFKPFSRWNNYGEATL